MLVGSCLSCTLVVVVFFKQKTAYEMRISDWSSDVCSSDLVEPERAVPHLDRIARKADYPLHIIVLAAAWIAEDGDVASVGRIGENATVETAERSEERRVGKACVSTCRSRGSPYH